MDLKRLSPWNAGPSLSLAHWAALNIPLLSRSTLADLSVCSLHSRVVRSWVTCRQELIWLLRLLRRGFNPSAYFLPTVVAASRQIHSLVQWFCMGRGGINWQVFSLELVELPRRQVCGTEHIHMEHNAGYSCQWFAWLSEGCQIWSGSTASLVLFPFHFNIWPSWTFGGRWRLYVWVSCIVAIELNCVDLNQAI